jgi:N6-L-threonylcarbamoyladenine synthase
MNKLILASKELQINNISIAGGVSANAGLRSAIIKEGDKNGWNCYIPPFKFTTDNAAMVAITGYFKYIQNRFASQEIVPFARHSI